MLKAVKVNERVTKMLFDYQRIGSVIALSPGHFDTIRFCGREADRIGHYSTYEAALLSFVGVNWREYTGPKLSGLHKCHYEPYREPVHKQRWAQS